MTMTPNSAPARDANVEAFRRVRFALLESGSSYDVKRRAWKCPSCKCEALLRVCEVPDGSLRLECRGWHCAPHHILAALGLSFFDVGPAQFRRVS